MGTTVLALAAMTACAAIALGHEVPMEAAAAPLFLGWHPIEAIKAWIARRYLARTHSPSETTRDFAYFVVSKFRDASLRQRLYQGLSDPSAHVRLNVVRWLRANHDLHALPAIRMSYPHEVDRQVAQALSDLMNDMRVGKPRLKPVVVDSAVDSPDGCVRAAAIAGAPRGHLSAQQLRALVTCDPEPAVRLAALSRLAELPPEAAIGIATDALTDNDEGVRREAIRALSRRNDLVCSQPPRPTHVMQSAYDALKLRIDPCSETPNVRWRAARFLHERKQIGDAALKEVCRSVIEYNGKLPVELETILDAARMLAELATVADSGLLRTLARSKHVGIREFAVTALAAFPSPETIAVLLNVAEGDDAASVVRQAIASLKQLAPELWAGREERRANEAAAAARAKRRAEADAAFDRVFTPDAHRARQDMMARSDEAYGLLKFQILGDPKRLAALRALADLGDAGARWFLDRYYAEAAEIADAVTSGTNHAATASVDAVDAAANG